MKELPARPLQLAMRIYYRPPSIQYTTMLNVERSGASAGVVAQRRFTLALYAFFDYTYVSWVISRRRLIS